MKKPSTATIATDPIILPIILPAIAPFAIFYHLYFIFDNEQLIIRIYKLICIKFYKIIRGILIEWSVLPQKKRLDKE